MTAALHVTELVGRFVALIETGAAVVEMKVTLRYDAARPFQVDLTFGTADTSGRGVTWAVGRELLVEGVTGSAGVLDVLLNTYALGDDLTVITLRPPGVEPAHILLPTFPLSEFLAVTEELVPPGTESATIPAGSLDPTVWDLIVGEPGTGERLRERGVDERHDHS